MLPGEDETRRMLRQQHADVFQFAEDALTLAYEVHVSLCGNHTRRYGRMAHWVCVAALTKLCNQYRSIHALCELGLTQDAGILLRAMFEALLRLEFILCKSPPILPNSPRKPRLTVNFRAKLYFADGAVALEKTGRMLKKHKEFQSRVSTLEAIAIPCINNITKEVGDEWIDWHKTRKKSMFGMGVDWMACKLGKENMYDSVYRFESESTHACDLEQFLEPDGEGNVIPTLSPDTRATTEPLLMATEFLLIAAGVVSDRFHLDHERPIAVLLTSVESYCNCVAMPSEGQSARHPGSAKGQTDDRRGRRYPSGRF